MPFLSNRRSFLKATTLSTVGTLAASNWILDSLIGSFPINQSPNSRSFAPFLIAEDVLRLTQLLAVDKLIPQALTVNQNYFHLGKAWVVAPEELLKLAKHTQSLWKTQKDLDRAQMQLALMAGKVAHDTIRQYLPSEKAENQKAKAFSDLPEATLYQDTYVLKMIQNADPHRQNIVPDQPLAGVSPENIAELFHLIQQRNLIRMHTNRPEFSDIETWMDNYLTHYHQMKKDNQDYSKVYCLPNAKKFKKYIVDTHFYHANDAIIAASRQLQMGRVYAPKALKAKVNNSEKATSIYGKAIQTALNKVAICGNYVLGNATEGEMKAVFNG